MRTRSWFSGFWLKQNMKHGAKRGPMHSKAHSALACVREACPGGCPAIGWMYGCAERSELEKQTSTCHRPT